jgi:hypothetical protein|nr:MAG TPA: hypothetical protein [Caudoviricetes sp.]
MRYLIKNKVYDTEKAQEIIKYIKQIKHKGLFVTTYPKYRHTLYKTQKGQFFVHIGECLTQDTAYSHKNYIELLSNDEVKEILNQLNEVDLYQQLFDDLEEG